MHVGDGHVLGEGAVHGGHHGSDRPPLLGSVVVGVVPDDHRVLSTKQSEYRSR